LDVETVDVDLYQAKSAEMDEKLRQAQPNYGVSLVVKNSKDGYAPAIDHD